MKKISILLCALVLSGCAGMNNQQSGQLTGAVVGGLIGSQFGHGAGSVLGAGIGVIAGSIIGGNIGRYMDASDQQRANQVLERNKVGQSTSWRNPDSGNSYLVEPTRTYSSRGNQICREYITHAKIGGKTEQIHGTACRQADGSWRTQ